MKKIFILTGEPSGDKLASTVISPLLQLTVAVIVLGFPVAQIEFILIFLIYKYLQALQYKQLV